jgi:hypothetical protein
VVEHLPSKHEALSSNPSIFGKKRKKENNMGKRLRMEMKTSQRGVFIGEGLISFVQRKDPLHSHSLCPTSSTVWKIDLTMSV